MTVRVPQLGERIRVSLKNGTWIWDAVREIKDDDYGCGFYVTGGIFRDARDYKVTWRFPEDDPEACAERAAIKGRRTMNDECICPANVPSCPACGRRWDWYREYSDGRRRYTSDAAKQKYVALHGNEGILFRRVEDE